MNRKKFLGQVAGTAALVALNGSLPAQVVQSVQLPQIQDVPPLPLDLVKEFVIAGHGNFAKVQAMLKDTPNLIFTKFDWGNGDYEAAIEGAGHVGDKEIANYLIDAGSRVTLYVLTMLGRTDLVKPVLEAYPSLITAKGPHGFTLLHHAKAGGKDGEQLYDYLQEKGLRDDRVKLR
jgi:hypothetical protein